MCARWVSTVRAERKSCSPISTLVWPSAISRRTSTSRSREVVGWAGGLGRRGGDLRAEPRVEVGVAGGGEPDRLQQLLVGGLLEHEAERAGLQRLAGEGGVVLHREHDDRGLVAQPRDRLQARAAGHVEVEHEHGRPVRAGQPLGVGDGAGLRDHLQAFLVVDQHPQALADDGVVVGDHDGGLAAVGANGGHAANGSLTAVDEAGLRRLLDVGRSLVTVLDPEVVLRRALDVARELTGARYAAIGVLDASRERLERFVTAGIDGETRRAIGDPPRGHGVLGVLIKDPRPLRLPRRLRAIPSPTASRPRTRRCTRSSASRS